MLENNGDEDVCRKWDDLEEQDHTYRMSESEYFHYRQNWWISLISPETNVKYESLRNSRPYWNCAVWRFIGRIRI